MQKREHHKIVLLGPSGVGKSSITLRYVKNSFSLHRESTIGAAFLSAPVSYKGRDIQLDIWDTAGQERYNSLAPIYYRGASAAIIVYDITSVDSFHQAKRWIRELHDDCIVILVGNKLDLQSIRDVPIEVAKNYSNEIFVEHLEVSAKDSIGVHDIFDKILNKLPQTTNFTTDVTSDITNENKPHNKSCKCRSG